MDKKEILRYLLTRSTVQDEALNSLIDEIIAEAQRSCTPKSIYRIFDCSVSEDTLTVCLQAASVWRLWRQRWEHRAICF